MSILKHRTDIDGLRALAIIPVVLNHAGFELFSGGYVGVDVFFVISGYLITSIIISESKSGSFTFLGFYERRVRRILPALFAVLFACLLVTWFWMPPTEFKEFSVSIITVSLFVYNLFYIHLHSYFTPEAGEQPLLHTWSLAVEEQYYLLIPLLIVLFWNFKRQWLIAFILLVATISFCVSEYGSRYHSAANFYLTPSRAWELLIGTLLAFINTNKAVYLRLSNNLNNVLSFSGLLAIFYSILFFDSATRFPSAYTLFPTIGTALIIGFASPQTIVAKILSLKIFVGIGLISYSVYLWHQPLFAYARFFSLDEPSIQLLISLCIVSLLLGFLSWKFIETPFRNRNNFKRSQVFSAAAMITVFFIFIGISGQISGGFPNRSPYFASLERYQKPLACLNHEKVTQKLDWNCLLNSSTDELPSFFVLGDSHAQSMMIAFENASSSLNKQGIISGFPGCIPLMNVYRLRAVGDEIGICHYLNQRVFDFIKENNISHKNKPITDIYLVARWTAYTDGDYTGNEDAIAFIGVSQDSEKSKAASRKAFSEAIDSTVKEFNNIGVRINIISQVPHQKIDPEKIYTQMHFVGRSYQDFYELSVSFDEHQKLQRHVENTFLEYSEKNLLSIINFEDVFCNQKRCPFGSEDVSYYVNEDHISNAGADLVVARLSALLK